MNKLTIKTVLLMTASLLACTGTLHAQQDHLIENQRDVLIIDDTNWGDTYIGKYTTGNGLFLINDPDVINTNDLTLTSADAFVGYAESAYNNLVEVSLSNATWKVSSLNIGATNNTGNIVHITDYGTVEIAEGLSIHGASNTNGLLLVDNGTLYVKSDVDASMDGFAYSNATLKVGGELSGLDNVFNAMSIFVTGEERGTNATWNVNSGTLTVGLVDDNNSVLLEKGALLTTSNLWIGGISSTGNTFVVDSDARAHIQNEILILNGASNSLQVSNGGTLEVDMDFDATVDGLELQYGGLLEAHGNLILGSLQGGASLTLSGTNATWLNRSGLSLAVGTITNGSTLTVTSEAEVRAGWLDVGALSNDNNTVYVNDGGHIIIEGLNNSSVNGTNAIWLTDGGKITFESDYSMLGDGSFYWGNGGILEVQGAFPVFTSTTVENDFIENGTLFLQRGKTLILNGSSAVWNAPTHNLHVGDLSSNNNLILTNGAFASVKSLSIGDFKEGGHNNQLIISGIDSELVSIEDIELGGRILAGEWVDGGVNNIIRLENGGTLTSLGTLHNRNGTGTSGIELLPDGIIDVDNYYQASGAFLNIYTDSSGTNSGLLQVSDTAEFETGAKFGFDAIASLEAGKVYSNKLVEAGTLIVGGVTNATTADLNALEKTNGLLVNYELWEQDQDIHTFFTRKSIADAGNLNGTLADISSEITRLAGLGNAAASNQLVIIDNMGSSQELKREMEQQYSYQIPTYMHNQGIIGGIDQVRARSSSFSGGGAAGPSGAGGPGPHSGTQGFQPWVKVYGNVGNRDADDDSGFDDGYDVQAFGTVLGIDKAFGPLLLGVAGGFANSSITGDNDDESDASTSYGLLYGTIGTNDWFGDIILSFGVSDIENTSGGAFDVESDVDASQTIFYIGGGKEFKDPDGSAAVLRPMIGMQVSLYDQDAYTEESTTAVAKDVAAYDRTSYLSTLGIALVLPKDAESFNIETELSAYWLHEFNDDEDVIDYSLVGSTTPGQFVVRSPDENIGQVGIGIAADSKHSGLKLRAGLDAQFSKTYASFTLSGALLYEF